jgi:hypothetical protein
MALEDRRRRRLMRLVDINEEAEGRQEGRKVMGGRGAEIAPPDDALARG